MGMPWRRGRTLTSWVAEAGEEEGSRGLCRGVGSSAERDAQVGLRGEVGATVQADGGG